MLIRIHIMCAFYLNRRLFLPCSPPIHSPTILFHAFVVPEQLPDINSSRAYLLSRLVVSNYLGPYGL